MKDFHTPQPKAEKYSRCAICTDYYTLRSDCSDKCGDCKETIRLVHRIKEAGVPSATIPAFIQRIQPAPVVIPNNTPTLAIHVYGFEEAYGHMRDFTRYAPVGIDVVDVVGWQTRGNFITPVCPFLNTKNSEPDTEGSETALFDPRTRLVIDSNGERWVSPEDFLAQYDWTQGVGDTLTLALLGTTEVDVMQAQAARINRMSGFTPQPPQYPRDA